MNAGLFGGAIRKWKELVVPIGIFFDGCADAAITALQVLGLQLVLVGRRKAGVGVAVGFDHAPDHAIFHRRRSRWIGQALGYDQLIGFFQDGEFIGGRAEFRVCGVTGQETSA